MDLSDRRHHAGRATTNLTQGAAERYGATAWLERFIDRLLASATLGDTARALTIAGLREPNHQSDTLLARSADIGFLSEVAEFSLKNYRRDSWARRWLEAASSASDGISFWRFGVLAEGVVDARTARLLEHDRESPTVQLHGEELTERSVRAAEKRSKDRKTTLFGLKAPPQDIVDALRHS